MHIVSTGVLRVWVSRAVRQGTWPCSSRGRDRLISFLGELECGAAIGPSVRVSKEPEYFEVGLLKVSLNPQLP
jgi:hypothetical protein